MTSLALLMVLTSFATPSLAQGRGRARGRVDSRVTVVLDARSFDRDGRRAAIRGRDFDRRRFDRDDRVRVIVRERGLFGFGAGRPPGWDRGRKVGWGNCDLPPGLAKKYGCSGFGFRDTRFPRRGPVVVIPIR